METKRPIAPAAEEILGGYFPVLDHGFVSLVDYMGTDDSVERAARVSYGYGTRKVSQTRGLIRYLRRHLHTTPSEMVEFKFHCAMPMFVARQWIRHRTACLAEGTEVYFDLPGGIRRRGNQLYKLPIEEIWKRFQPTRNRTRPDKQRDPYFRRTRVEGMRLRQVNEDTLRIQHTRVVDVYKNGPKPVFRVRLADGKEITATSDHQFLFADGWSTLKKATGLRVAGGRAVWDEGPHFLHVNGVVREAPPLYRDKDWLDEQYNVLHRRLADIAEDCGVSTHTVRKWLRAHSIQGKVGRGRFKAGQRPWNQGKRYELGPRDLSRAWIEANRRSRAGEASNFWRGGTSSDRESIGRWTTQVAARIHRQNHWTCQLCEERAEELHCHHIVPVWADPGLARDLDNLTTLCGGCHRDITGRELDYVERFTGEPVKTEWKRRPRVPWNRIDYAKLVRIESLEYVGERETYDLEVEGPYHNFIANGVVTHNSVNEYSGRYSLMPLLFHRPEPEHFGIQSAENNQGREPGTGTPELYQEASRRWEAIRGAAADTYSWMVGENVARELARIDLPLSTYTQWYWKIDLHNLLHFLTLRADPHAQWEIQAYARVMAGMVKRVAPLSFEAWLDYQVMGDKLSRAEIVALARLIDPSEEGLRVRDGASMSNEDLKEVGLSAREIRELRAKLHPREVPDYELDLSTMRDADDVAEEMYEAVPIPPE